MNADELVQELKKVGELFNWHWLPQTLSPESERRAKPRFKIRAEYKDGPAGIFFEPIGAVCFVRTGIAYDEDHWLEAAVSLGLSAQDAKDLMAAANDLTWRQFNGQRKPHPYREVLRRSIAEAVGLYAVTD